MKALALLVVLIALFVSADVLACDTHLEDAVAGAVNPDGDVGHPGRVGRAVARAIAKDCRAGKMVDPDHYREPSFALGSCELDAVALMLSAWEEGHFCLGAGPQCPRGDGGRSAGTFQVAGYADGAWSPELTDRYELRVDEAAAAAYGVIRWGAATCPDEPLAPYCGGCYRRGAREMGAARLGRARALLASFADAP